MRFAISVFFTLIFFAVRPAQAAPVIFGNNAYEFISQNSVIWNSAKVAASNSIFMGANGHLATITSQAENDFLASLITSRPTGFAGAWLGGDYQGWLLGPETGQALTYTNWNTFEPNNSGIMYMSI